MLSTAAADSKLKKRVEFLAPLDNLIWDRELIKELFDFNYKWEIYTPVKDRKFGYYVLPVLYGEDFAGRIEIVRNKKNDSYIIKNIWFEKEGLSQLKPLIKNKLDEFSEVMF